MASSDEKNRSLFEPEEGNGSDVSRREWLLSFGQAAVVLVTPGELQADAAAGRELPPGLYAPSTSHLGHALMSAGRFRPVPSGCPTDYVRPSNGPFQPQHFSEGEFRVIRRVTELLLGEESDHAVMGQGSVTQEVAEWIDLCLFSAAGVRDAAARIDPHHRAVTLGYYGSDEVKLLETSKPDEICHEGLGWLANEAQSRYGAEFLSLDRQQQTAILDSASDERPDKQLENAGTRFFDFIKREAIRGFYTSQAGLKELDFKGNAFYARSPGCKRP